MPLADRQESRRTGDACVASARCRQDPAHLERLAEPLVELAVHHRRQHRSCCLTSIFNQFSARVLQRPASTLASLPATEDLAITDEASPFALRSTRNASEDSSAPEVPVACGRGCRDDGADASAKDGHAGSGQRPSPPSTARESPASGSKSAAICPERPIQRPVRRRRRSASLALPPGRPGLTQAGGLACATKDRISRARQDRSQAGELTSSLSGFCPAACSPRKRPATWATDAPLRPLETAGNRSAPMACGPNVDQGWRGGRVAWSCPVADASGASVLRDSGPDRP